MAEQDNGSKGPFRGSEKPTAANKPAVKSAERKTVTEGAGVGAGAGAGAGGAIKRPRPRLRPETKTVVVKKRVNALKKTTKPLMGRLETKTSSARTGSARTGSARAGSARAGSATSGSATSGSAAATSPKPPSSPEEKRRLRRKIISKKAPSGIILRPLSEEEKKRREDATYREKLRKKDVEERAVAEALVKKDKETEDNKKLEEEKSRKEAESLRLKRREEEDARRVAEETTKQTDRESDKKKVQRPRTGDSKRRQTKLTIFNALDETEKQQSLSALRRRRQKQSLKTIPKQEKTHITREVVIPETISVIDLAARMAVRINDVIKFLGRQDIIVKADEILDADTAELVVDEFGHKVKRVAEADVEEAIDAGQDNPKNLQPRPPVVTIMGHVDHGKTSLLDALRKTSVVEGEAGGITQHIGAYQTQLKDGRKITFIDTPGHAAFTAMRARGAKTTDIVVLVIAADDSVMPQTIESIDHAKAAGTPIIIALNKTDLAGAQPDKIMQQLLQHEVICEPMGGEVQAVPISAKTGDGLEQLSEAIALQADIMELKANPERAAQGVVVEAHLDKGAGNVATILIQRGTLKKGDIFVAGSAFGKVRRMRAFDRSDLTSAPPSCPVWVTGLNGPVLAGDSFDCVESEARAREIAEYRDRQKRTSPTKGAEALSVEQIFSNVNKKPEIYYIVKADVQGSADAIKQAIENTSTDDIDIKVSHAGVGEVNPSDIMLAQTLNARVLMFNSKAGSEAQKAAKAAKITLYQFDVIYGLIDEVKIQAAKTLGPERRESHLGSALVLQLFSVGKKNTAAGCRIDEGQVKKDAHIRVKREDVIIHEGLIQSLRHFKENVPHVDVGKECGIVFDSAPKIQEGDIVECFSVEQVERSL